MSTDERSPNESDETPVVIRYLSPGELVKRLNDVWLVDVRPVDEYVDARIAQSWLLPDDWHAGIDLNPVSDRPAVLICASGKRANERARQYAAGRVTGVPSEPRREIMVLDGGLHAWKKAGYPVIRNDVDPQAPAPVHRLSSLERRARIVLGTLVAALATLGVFAHSAFIWAVMLLGLSMIVSGLLNFCGTKPLLARLLSNERTPS